MDASFAAELTVLKAATTTATQARELAHDRIVEAFRAQLAGMGPGPSDAQVQSFARLALVEQALQKELGYAAELLSRAERRRAVPDLVQ